MTRGMGTGMEEWRERRTIQAEDVGFQGDRSAGAEGCFEAVCTGRADADADDVLVVAR